MASRDFRKDTRSRPDPSRSKEGRSKEGRPKGGHSPGGPGKGGPHKAGPYKDKTGNPGKGGKPPRPGKPSYPGKSPYSGKSAHSGKPAHSSKAPYSAKPSRSPGKPSHAGKPSHLGKAPYQAKSYRQSGKPQSQSSDFRPQRPEQRARPTNDPGKWLYGIHAVQAALGNSRRKLGRLLLSRRAAEIIGEDWPDRVRIEIMEPDAIGKLLPPGAVHQGAALEAGTLPAVDLDVLLAEPSEGRRRVVLVLDQLSDPHNVGAILRSASAFGVTAVVVQDRHAPPQSGALAKAASGALDLIPYVEVVNITRALEKLAEHGFWRIALAGDGAQSLQEAIPAGDVALVVGSEGDGIRRLVREHCDTAALIPIDGAMESLNVSNAAAIALYELRRV